MAATGGIISFRALICIFFAVLPTSPVLGSLSPFQTQVLEDHNKLRKLYGNVPPLKMDDKLVAAAQEEAQKKVADFIKNEKFSPVPDDPSRDYNDNTWVFLAYSSIRLNGSRVLEDWTQEGKLHDFGKNDFNWKTAHFTQMVGTHYYFNIVSAHVAQHVANCRRIWKSTDSLGVNHAVGRTKDGKFINVVVIRYHPPGNVLDIDAFADNVLSASTGENKPDEKTESPKEA